MLIGPNYSSQNKNQHVGFQDKSGKGILKRIGKEVTDAAKRIVTVDPKIKEQTEIYKKIHSGEIKPKLVLDA